MPHKSFPYPRKASTPHLYTPATTRTSTYQKRRLIKRYAPPILALGAFLWLLIHLFSPNSPTINTPPPPPGTPAIVIVTPVDPKLSDAHNAALKENRNAYARAHGYATFFPNTTDYDLMDAKTPKSWSTIPSLRHAMTLHPHAQWLWHLSSETLITNYTLSLNDRLLNPTLLPTLLIKDQPVVPPDSVIKTIAHQSPDSLNFIISQDAEGLASGSFLLRTGEWAKFFLDAWFDPLYRSYNFQKAEGHALEHIVQWHGTILAKLGLVPQRELGGYYSSPTTNEANKAVQVGGAEWRRGDFVATFHGCARDVKRSCEVEMRVFMKGN